METADRSVDGFRPITSELVIYAVISFVVVLWCHDKWNRRHFVGIAAKMTTMPAYPIVGIGLEFIGTPAQIFQNILKLSNDYGPNPSIVWFGSKFAVAIFKPEDQQIVLNSSKALEKNEFYRFFKNTIGEKALIIAPVDKWKKHRRLIAPVFNNNLKQYFPVFIDKTDILITNLKKEVGKTEAFDLWDYIKPTALDIICQTAMGYNLNLQSNNESEFSNAWIKTSEMDSMRILKPWLYPEFIFNIYTKLMGLDKMYKTFHKLPQEVIKKMKAEYAKKKLSNDDDALDAGVEKRRKVFMDTLLELNEAGADFSDGEIRDHVISVMVGGSETNALTLCFCFLMLAIHQDVQDKVYDEIYDVFGDGDEVITIEETSKLVYTEQVIKETLRMYPIAPIIFRKLQDDVKLSTDDQVLPKGATCILGPLFAHHFSGLYPNSWEFDPERFSAENVDKRHRYSFLPFSRGPRNCIGSKYAMLSLKVVVSTFLRNYSVHTHVKLSDVALQVDMLLRSIHGYPVTIRPRDRRPTYKRKHYACA